MSVEYVFANDDVVYDVDDVVEMDDRDDGDVVVLTMGGFAVFRCSRTQSVWPFWSGVLTRISHVSVYRVVISWLGYPEGGTLFRILYAYRRAVGK